MVSHQPSCRRWRACMAMHNLVAPREDRSCKLSKQSGGFPKEHWDSLGSFISAMGSPDLVFKTEALHRLSLFLLYVAPTSESSFTCPDAFTISINFKNKDIFLPLKDIQVLYKILFSELTSYTAWLFRQESGIKESESKLSSFCSSQCDRVHLVLLVEVLHCCIRILPLLEFNTGLSLVAAETLISVLKQLCCPTNLSHLSAKGFDDVVECYRNQLLKTPHGSNEVQAHIYFENGHERSGAAVSWISSMEASIKGLQEHLSSHENMEIRASHMFGGNIMACSIHDTKTHTDRAQVACALLEVFMDELFLQPGLVDVLLASNVDAKLDSSSSGFSCGKHMQLTMEAAAVHFILSFSGFNHVELLQGNFETRHSAHYVSGMSLPAAVMLFDLSVADAVCAPYMFLVHIVNTLRRSLDSTSCLSPELPGEMVLGLAASVLESAVSLYSRFWTPRPLPTQHYNELHHSELINFLSEKFWAICDGDNKKIASVLELLFEESCSKPGQQECASTQPSAGFSCVADATFFGNERLESSYHAIQSACFHTRQDATSVYSGQEQDKILPTHIDCFSPSGSTYIVSNAALLVSVLQLMSAALLRLVAEAYKQDPRSKAIHFPKTATQEAPDGGHSCVNAELYIDNAKEAFKFCASMDRMKMLEDLKLDKQLQKLFYEGDEVTGHAFTFFVERLCLSFKQDAPKALCQAYLDVLKSLITLLVFTEQRRKMANPSYDTHLCEDLHVCPDDATMKKSDEEQNWEKPCNSRRQHNVVDFMSSTLIMTKKYQRKHRYITSTQKSSQRLNEARLSAEHKRVGSCSSALKLQEEGIVRRRKLAVHKNSSSSNDGNAYIEEMIANEGKVDGECFSDLSDFIVCKEGRDYSKWMKSIYKKRKKKLQRTYWERLKAKRALVSLLTCQGNDHF